VRVKRIIGILILGGALILATSLLSDLRLLLITNKAQYLANQADYHGAEELLEYVVGCRPEHEYAREVYAEVELCVGNYAEAERLLVGLRPTPRVVLERAICAYETDREDEAARILNTLPTSTPLAVEDSRIEFLIRGAKLVLNGEIPESTFLELSPSGLAIAYQRFLRSIQSRAALALGEFESARVFAEKAFAKKDRNSYVRRLAVILNAAAARFDKARYYADALSYPQFDWTAVLQKIQQLQNELTTQTVALEASKLMLERQAVLQAAYAWALAQKSIDSGDAEGLSLALEQITPVCTRLAQKLKYPLLRADILAAAGMPERAYKSLSELSSSHLSYPIVLRMTALAGELPDQAVEAFRQYHNLVRYVAASDLQTSGAKTRDGYLAFYTNGSAQTMIEIPASATYFIVVTARGDRAFGLSPLVRLSVDGKQIDSLYIAHDDWNTYEVAIYLEKGMHSLQLDYINNSERLPSNDEDRNFYLHNIMITRLDGYERGKTPLSE
jgi:flagellar biosynthesis regulator FlaF